MIEGPSSVLVLLVPDDPVDLFLSTLLPPSISSSDPSYHPVLWVESTASSSPTLHLKHPSHRIRIVDDFP